MLYLEITRGNKFRPNLLKIQTDLNPSLDFVLTKRQMPTSVPSQDGAPGMRFTLHRKQLKNR